MNGMKIITFKKLRFFSYIESLNISCIKKFHLSADAVPAVFDLSVHARHLLCLETLHLSLKLFVNELLLFFLESQQK